MLIKRNSIFLLLIASLCLPPKGFSQKLVAINHKGTKVPIINNTIFTTDIEPTTANQNDVWYDTSFTPRAIKIYNGLTWVSMEHRGTAGSVFYADENGDPSENNDRLFWDSDKDRLGVGTNAPTHRLEVEGTMAAEGIVNSNGSIGRPSYRFKNDIDTGISRLAADELSFIVGGYEALRIDELTVGVTKVIVNQTLELEGPLLDSLNSPGTVGQILSSTATGTTWIDHASLSMSTEAGNQITTAADGGIYYGENVHTGYFIITPPTTIAAGTSNTLAVDGLPFEPSQVTFSANANIEGVDINNNESGSSDLDNSFGSSEGFARKDATSTVQYFSYVGGSDGIGIRNTSRYSLINHCLGLRYSDQDGNDLGRITVKLESFDSDGFTLNAVYAQGTVGDEANKNEIFNENLLVIYTAYK